MKRFVALLLACLLVAGVFAGCAKKESKGSVYYLNFKPEFDAALQELAKKYTETTGVAVKVVTPAAGDYEKTLYEQMASEEPPTIFNISNLSFLGVWDDHALDLSATQLAGELSTNTFNLHNVKGQMKAIGYCYESYGIIVNTKLLGELGYDLSQITDFASLKTVAEGITAKSQETGVAAFTSAGLEKTSSWRFSAHLLNMPLFYEFRDDKVTYMKPFIQGSYLDELKNIWDLYIQNSTCTGDGLLDKTVDDAREEFVSGKAVFYQNGTWEYADLIKAGMKSEELAMIPIYCGVEGEEKVGLCSGTENHWAINSRVPEKDAQASLEFLHWLVTDPEVSRVLVDQLGAVPFKNCPASANKFVADGDALRAQGRYTVTWAFKFTPNANEYRATVVGALAAYSAGVGNWDTVKVTVVDGWAYEYGVENAK